MLGRSVSRRNAGPTRATPRPRRTQRAGAKLPQRRNFIGRVRHARRPKNASTHGRKRLRAADKGILIFIWDPSGGALRRRQRIRPCTDLVGTDGNGRGPSSRRFQVSAPCPFYAGYSANFFDASTRDERARRRTAAWQCCAGRPNWFQPHYPYVYATFRCVETDETNLRDPLLTLPFQNCMCLNSRPTSATPHEAWPKRTSLEIFV